MHKENWPDPRSRGLIDDFIVWRRSQDPGPDPRSLKTEDNALSSLVLAAAKLGHRLNLSQLLGEPQIVAKVLGGETYLSGGYLRCIQGAVMKLLNFVSVDGDTARSRQEELKSFLPRRMKHPRFGRLTARTVGGYRDVRRFRPVLAQVHLDAVVECAGHVRVTQSRECNSAFDRLLAASAAYCGTTMDEFRQIRIGDVVLRTPTPAQPWCADIQNVTRLVHDHREFAGRNHGGGRNDALVRDLGLASPAQQNHSGGVLGLKLTIPLHVKAEPCLRAALELRGSEGPNAFLFASPRFSGEPLSCVGARRIVAEAVKAAGLPPCDETTMRRAYASFLEQEGVRDFIIADALGVGIRSVEGYLRRNRRSLAQRTVLEHHVLEIPTPQQSGLPQIALPTGGVRIEGMRILGVDPSYWRSGWAAVRAGENDEPLIEAGGTIEPGSGNKANGLVRIESEFREVLSRHRPGAVWFEKPGRWMRGRRSNRESIELMAMVRGVMMKCCALESVEVFDVDFQAARRLVLGDGRAKKADVIAFMESNGLLAVPADNDVADAAVVALYGLAIALGEETEDES